ncbi:hypothetical protein, partial [Hydrogenophaga sp.]|uniref:hypothetical protein n=1 Tax=Hydrogenophaga sp. TaxID=1904254 RepID=UPI002605B796
SGLKIRVSMVRFRPRPPNFSQKPIHRDGLFRFRVPRAVLTPWGLSPDPDWKPHDPNPVRDGP